MNARGELRCSNCQTVEYPLADVSARFAANLVDTFVVMIPPLVAFGVAILGAAAVAGPGGGEDDPAAALASVAALGVGGMAFLVMCGLQVFMQVRFGRSAGKWLVGIRVLMQNGSVPELWRIILLRNVVVHVLSQACGLLGLIDALMIFGAERRCLHDLMAGTIVVSDPR